MASVTGANDSLSVCHAERNRNDLLTPIPLVGVYCYWFGTIWVYLIE